MYLKTKEVEKVILHWKKLHLTKPMRQIYIEENRKIEKLTSALAYNIKSD